MVKNYKLEKILKFINNTIFHEITIFLIKKQSGKMYKIGGKRILLIILILICCNFISYTANSQKKEDHNQTKNLRLKKLEKLSP